MADIWNQVAAALDGEVNGALWKLRESDLFKEMGSELERAFAAYFVLMLRIGDQRYELAKTPRVDCGFFLIPQFEIGPYRVDFVFGHSKTNFEVRQSVAIECDGHDWHEKTKEQAARDKKRDRFLQKQFGSVLHFTGSEIYRDTPGCLHEALQALSVVWDRHRK